jgi:hypothetical protein
VAPPRRGPRFAGPALAAFESEQATAEGGTPETGGAEAGDGAEAGGGAEAGPGEPSAPATRPAGAAIPTAEDLDEQAAHFSNLLSSPDGEQPAEEAPEDRVYSVPPSVAVAPARSGLTRSLPPPPGGAVPRALYDQLLAEKQELQQRLIAVLDERSDGTMVPRELFDQVQAEKRLLQEKMMMMLDELLKLRSQPAAPERNRIRQFPGRKGGDK